MKYKELSNEYTWALGLSLSTDVHSEPRAEEVNVHVKIAC